MSNEEILDLLRQTGALLTGHFLLSSGLHSDKYVQCARFLQHPELAEIAGIELVRKYEAAGLTKPDSIASPALGGMIIGQEVARAFKIRHIFVEKDDAGTPALRRGFSVREGETFAIVEDVVTTGKSTKETISVIKGFGAVPLAILCIFNRSGFDKLGNELPIISLASEPLNLFEPDNCPLCAENIPLEKPGSRKMPPK